MFGYPSVTEGEYKDCYHVMQGIMLYSYCGGGQRRGFDEFLDIKRAFGRSICARRPPNGQNHSAILEPL